MKRLFSTLAMMSLLASCPRVEEPPPGPIAYPDLEKSPVQLTTFQDILSGECVIRTSGFRNERGLAVCTISEIVDGCAFQTCELSPMGGEHVDIGLIRATSPCLGNGTTLSWGGTDYLQARKRGSFAPEELVHVTNSTISDVGHFELEVRVPTAPTGVSFGGCRGIDPTAPSPPACAAEGPSPLVEWSGGSHFVLVTLTAVDTHREKLICAFDAAPGRGAVPATALAKLRHDTAYEVKIGSAVLMSRSGEVGLQSFASTPDVFTRVKL